jgi:hypothetical protein
VTGKAYATGRKYLDALLVPMSIRDIGKCTGAIRLIAEGVLTGAVIVEEATGDRQRRVMKF